MVPLKQCNTQSRIFIELLKQRYSTWHLAPVVRRADNAIHWINHYPADSVVCFVNTYPLDSDLSGG